MTSHTYSPLLLTAIWNFFMVALIGPKGDEASKSTDTNVTIMKLYLKVKPCSLRETHTNTGAKRHSILSFFCYWLYGIWILWLCKRNNQKVWTSFQFTPLVMLYWTPLKTSAKIPDQISGCRLAKDTDQETTPFPLYCTIRTRVTNITSSWGMLEHLDLKQTVAEQVTPEEPDSRNSY